MPHDYHLMKRLKYQIPYPCTDYTLLQARDFLHGMVRYSNVNKINIYEVPNTVKTRQNQIAVFNIPASVSREM